MAVSYNNLWKLLIEVKGDNMIDDAVVNAKKEAAEELAVASGVRYLMYAGSRLMKSNVLEEETEYMQQTFEGTDKV